MNREKIGVLLINLGTPDNCDPKSVYAYLKQFLNDPRVIDLPTLVRYILVNWVIIPFRYKQSAHAYQQIWSDRGSPLLTNSQDLVEAVRKEFDSTIQIELGMRYGNPSIEAAVHELKDCQKIIAIPLFPQYASAATGSATKELLRVLGDQWNIPEISVQRDFFNNCDFIAAYASLVKEHLKDKKMQTLIFSFHGLPERHIDKSDCRAVCSRSQPCPKPTQLNAYCYRAQCYETARLIAKALDLSSSEYVVSFQSRLGKTPWIKPYTDLVLEDLRQRKVENIAIVCPSFVSDCLETLEEINIRARAQWLALGGHDFVFIPCLNTHPTWVQGLVNMIKKQVCEV
ncbi:MAG: ferrochelatase [Legionella sp.]|nr:ferrochelatase [Legionella sp.]